MINPAEFLSAALLGAQQGIADVEKAEKEAEMKTDKKTPEKQSETLQSKE